MVSAVTAFGTQSRANQDRYLRRTGLPEKQDMNTSIQKTPTNGNVSNHQRQQREDSDRQAVEQFLTTHGLETKKGLEEALRLSRERIKAACDTLLDQSCIEPTRITKPAGAGSKEHDGYEIVAQ